MIPSGAQFNSVGSSFLHSSKKGNGPELGTAEPCPARPVPGLSKIHIPPSSKVAQVELYAGAGFMRVSLETADFLQPSLNPGKRGMVTHFSDASRRRMMDLLAKMDYAQ